jgi:ABC-2 type transport system ATP-binding protein
VLDRLTHGPRYVFEVESLGGQNTRPDIARAIVHAGWNLIEMKSSTMTLEEVFLEITGSPTGQAEPVAAGEVA